MSDWIITDGTTEGTFADLDLSKPQHTFLSQAADKATFNGQTDFDSSPLFAHGAEVTIKKRPDDGDDINWISGTVVSLHAMGNPAEENIHYEIAGPWVYLERCVYQQGWQMRNEGEGEPTEQFKSRVILNQNTAGDRITSGAQITAALNYAISRGAPIAIGTIEPTLDLPWTEAVDITCAEVIVRMLRWSPECVTEFDYTTSPPTFHCRKRANLPSVSLGIGDSSDTESLSITPRYDLQIPGVILRYEKVNSTDDGNFESMTEDSAGDTTDIATLISTIELAGYKWSFITQDVVVEDWPDDGGGPPVEDLNNKEFWKSKVPWVNELADVDITAIENGARTGSKPRILTEGTLHDWMGVQSEEETVTVDITALTRDEDTNPSKIATHKISFRCTATNANTKTYRSLSSFTSAEPTPVGLAAALYASWSALQYDGQFVTVEDEVSGTIRPGNRFNITGSVAAWETMDAQVEQVVEDVDTGRTTIIFGPKRRLGPEDLVALLRSFRTRSVAIHHKSRETGDSADSGNSSALSGPAPKNQVTSADKEVKKLILRDTSGVYPLTISLDPTIIPNTGGVVDIQPRVIEICEDGEIKSMVILASATYDAPP